MILLHHNIYLIKHPICEVFLEKFLSEEDLPEYLQLKLKNALYMSTINSRLAELNVLDMKYNLKRHKYDFYESAAQLRNVHRYILESALSLFMKNLPSSASDRSTS